MKQYEALMMPHMKRLYIYDGREDEPLGVSTMVAVRVGCKLKTMDVKDIN